MSSPAAERIHSMDALRASTMLLLVPVHAALLLATNGYEGGWSVKIFWLVHVFRLPLFFAMSGFFLVFLISRKGIRLTLRNRTLRIAVPLAVGVLTLVPLFFWLCELVGLSAFGSGVHSDAGEGFALRLNYLWFLWYLLVIDGIAFVAYIFTPQALAYGSRLLGRVLARPEVGLAVFAMPVFLLLFAQPSWAGLPAPPNGRFVPELAPLAYNGVFFVFGATLCANRSVIASLRDNCWPWAGVALVTTIVAAGFFEQHNSSLGDRAYMEAAINATDAVATLSCLFALIGLANRYLDKSRPKLRYMADSSYWIYLSHPPILALIVGAIVAIGTIGTVPAFLCASLGTIAVSLAMYPVFIRYTPIGRTLNGPRKRTKPSLWRRLLGTTAPDGERAVPVSRRAEAAEPRA